MRKRNSTSYRHEASTRLAWRISRLGAPALLFMLACVSSTRPQPQPVTESWRALRQTSELRQSSNHRLTESHAEASSAATQAAPSPPPSFDDARAPTNIVDDSAASGVLATVNGRPIERARMIELLLRSHGLDLLEQLIAREAAIELAEKKGIAVTADDIQREYYRSLGRLADPLATITPKHFDRINAEELLRQLLAERDMSRRELMVIVERNAYLRKIAASELVLSPTQVSEEFRRMYGPQVEISHIQMGSLQDVTRVREQLALGVSFEDAAKQLSANRASAVTGGRLTPFSANDHTVPKAIRQQAFQLAVSEVSETIRVGPWFHLIRVERFVPAADVSLADVRDVVVRQARERLAEQAMRRQYEAIIKEAVVEIHDPVLRALYLARTTQKGR